MTDQINGTLRAFDPQLVFDNPFQHPGTRRTGGPEFEQFVEDVRANGVRTPPPARPHPDVSGAVQLREGHRRFAAHKIAFPGQPFTVLVQSISEEDMLDDCIRENVFRADWNDIEIAEMMETYLRVHPNATNAELARKFNYKNSASIPNVRKLLRLPTAIQAHVISNALPDAIARSLVGVSAVNPKAAQKIADAVAEASKSEKQDTFERMTRNLYWNQLTDLEREHGWSLDWLADAPVTVDADLGDGDRIIGACGGCVFNVNNKCARRACFDEKFKLWAAAEVQRVAAKRQIAIAGPDESVSVLFTGEYSDDDRAQDLLNARKEIKKVLRLAPLAEPSKRYFPLMRVLGSNAVTLVTTDKSAIDAYFAERNAASKSKTSAAVSIDKDTESDAAREKRLEQERRDMDAKRAARSKMWKSYYDGLWILEQAALEIGAALAKQHRGHFVGFITIEFCRTYAARLGAEAIAKRFEAEFKKSTDAAMREQWQLSHVALNVIAHEAINPYFHAANNERETSYEKVHREVLKVCSGDNSNSLHVGFGVTLPEGWDVPPVHHTAFNCWHCGRFAGNMSEKLTKRDIDEEGWVDDGNAGVFCSQEHKDAYLAAAQPDEEHHAKPNKAQRTKDTTQAKRTASKPAKRTKRK